VSVAIAERMQELVPYAQPLLPHIGRRTVARLVDSVRSTQVPSRTLQLITNQLAKLSLAEKCFEPLQNRCCNDGSLTT
jgi:hypothetical protein